MLTGIPYDERQRSSDHLSPSALKLLSRHQFFQTTDDLLMSPWFGDGPAEPFFGNRPSPLFPRRGLAPGTPGGQGEPSKVPANLRRMHHLRPFDPARDTRSYKPPPRLAMRAAKKGSGEEEGSVEEPGTGRDEALLGAVGGVAEEEQLEDLPTPSPGPLRRQVRFPVTPSSSSSSLSSGIRSFNRQIETPEGSPHLGQEPLPLRLPVRRGRTRSVSPDPGLVASAHQAVESGLEEVRAGSAGHPSIRQRIGRSLSSMRVVVGRGVRRLNCFGRHGESGSGRDSGRGETRSGSRTSTDTTTGELRRSYMH